MREQLLAALSQYGSPVLFAVVTVAAIGVPLPVTLLLIVTGSLTAQGVMRFGWAIGIASVGAILGDQVGYFAGRFGGHALVHRLSRVLGGQTRLEDAQRRAREWGGAAVFFSRWLIGALGPWINLATGAAEYPWARFFVWDVLGEVLGSAIYVTLGLVFSDRVLTLEAVLGDLMWAIVAGVAALLLGWRLLRYLRS